MTTFESRENRRYFLEHLSSESKAPTVAIRITEYNQNHHEDLLSLVSRVNEADPAYPPSGSVHVQNEDWGQWLFEEPVFIRLVALNDDKIVGHIVLESAHDYITDRLTDSSTNYLEIGQFFVDPAIQREGIGNKLFQSACQDVRLLRSKISLVVLDGSDSAKRFYLHHGLREVSKFTGRDGVNTIFVED